MPRFRIMVTGDDIRNGRPDSPCGCPVALATARAIGIKPGLGEIDVDPEGIHLAGRRGLRKASRRLPCEAISFIDDFDAGRPVDPFEFGLTIRTKKRDGQEG